MFFAFLHIFASLHQCAGRRIAALHRQSGMLSSIVARATMFYKKGELSTPDGMPVLALF